MKDSYIKFFIGRSLPFIALLFLSLTVQSQVGIGNTNPNPSSALDITSTTQGLLAPRMTTAQRTTIATPANSLLVYDTDLKSFYYYNLPSTAWVKINSGSDQRNNYKLVKSAADLAPELVAGGGNSYKLFLNTYYEINGTITLAAPINLNDAFVSGLDANEDKLIRTNGPVFEGITGGNIRNVTISGGSGASAFNITGGTTLVIQNTIIANLGSVGTISNVGLYFGNIIQFINNTTGITYSNISSLLLSNQGWFATNSGTFETYIGTFGLIEKVNGVSNVLPGRTGMQTTGITSITDGAVLSQVVFYGGGTYVNGSSPYTGYNFSKDWTVDCPGIPREGDGVATGDINLSADVGSGAVTTFSGTGTSSRKKVAGTTTSNSLFRFTRDGDNKIIYKGSKKRYFQVAASVSYQSTADLTLILYIAKNGSVITETKVYGRGATGFFTNAGILALPIIGTIELKTNDYIEIWAERFDGAGNMNTVSLNLIAR
ncbi:hypothetical protein Aeqsu_0948 [Aequorivita sublithincola DSM 14238]|uniref:Cell wall anchor protein n=1 Tax=Aequorivita sublithincola (strain DSM 14238 / LMG 21431 / ACAM 643 / 9-3) TaxID=746697 RepID=I3YTY2_AEQSU|nr:hypothetical protein [Aequorivita sublithincola]AFL80450.1 hypothetical protein Aeqsu_0948 [Aequorivita sublithincola DSM 14238]